MRAATLLLPLGLLLVGVHMCFCQSEGVPPVVAFGQCEEGDGCTIWNFNGGHAIASWESNHKGELTLESLTPTAVHVTRKDTSGQFTGWRFEYTGAIRNGWDVEGTVSAWRPDSTSPKPDATVKWRAILQHQVANTAPSPATATGWIVCGDAHDACSSEHPPETLAWALGTPTGVGHSLYEVVQYDTISLLVVESDRPNQVIIRSIDASGEHPAIAIYTGTREGPVMGGKIVSMGIGYHQPFEGNWVARQISRSCDASAANVSYFARGVLNLTFGDEQSAVHCWDLGHDKKENRSEAMLERGYEGGAKYTPKDLKKALYYSIQSAGHGNLLMMHNTSEMYKQGIGTPVDTLRSKFWDDVESLRKQELRDEATQQRASNSLEAVDAMFTSEFLHNFSVSDQALRGRVEHRHDVIKYMDSGLSRVQAEENAARDEIGSRQEELTKCRTVHAGDKARFDAEQTRQKDQARIDGRVPRPAAIYQDACMADQMDLNVYSSGSQNYLACVRQFVDSEAIEAHCTY